MFWGMFSFVSYMIQQWCNQNTAPNITIELFCYRVDPAGIYLLKVIDSDTGKMCEICSNLVTMKIPKRRH